MSTNIKLHKMDLPKKVIIGECWARDGLQNEAKIVSTDEKVEIITRMVEAGCTKFEATSFAHPKYLPQFADAEEVLSRIPRKEGVQYRAICTTMRAVERAIASKEEGYGVDEIAMGISTGIDQEQMIQAGRRGEEILGRKLRSNFIDAGPVPHHGIEYDKTEGIVETHA